MKFQKSSIIFCISFIITIWVIAQDTTNNKFGKGIYNVISKDSSYSMNFSMRIQSLYLGEWNINDSSGIGTGSSEFAIRRARLKFQGFAHSPKLTYKLELGLSNGDISGASSHTGNSPRYILDAVVQWNFFKNVTLTAGQTKLPGNRERVISSANMQFVDRSLLNSDFNIDRDMGMQLSHEFTIGKNFIVNEVFAVSQGEGRNITVANLGGYQYTSRIEIFPFGSFTKEGDYVGGDIYREKKPKLSIGATYDLNDRSVKTQSNMGNYMVNDEGYFSTDIATIFVDGMFKYNGFSFMGEYASRTAEKDSAFNSDGTPTGAVVQAGNAVNLQMGYIFNNNWEVAGRYTGITMNKKITGKDAETQYTLCISRYIVGHKLKVQSDISYLTVANSSNSELMYRLQFDLHL